MRRSILLVVFLFGLYLVACNSGQPSIAMDTMSLNLGKVVNGEIINRELTVRNNGETDLVIDSIITSCACTLATVEPMTIPADYSGILRIEFDSGFHGPEFEGSLIRQVFINSNDPEMPELIVELNVIVLANEN
jgi:hypothetical protein